MTRTGALREGDAGTGESGGQIEDVVVEMAAVLWAASL